MTSAKPRTARGSLMRAVAGLLFGAVAHAQTPGATLAPESSGTVAGQVLNEATRDYLNGASVRADGTNIEAVTGETGDFSLRLPTGAHVLVVDYIGLKQARVPVTVRAGQVTTVTVPLNSDVYQLEAVTVKGLREGQAAAIQSQRKAMNVKTSAAIDAFGNPASGVGELLQRLPGVAVDLAAGGEIGAVFIRGMSQDFGSLMVDGSQVATSGGTNIANGNVYFGQWDTGAIASLEVVKAPTPDMDGNAISGYINMRTKRAFERAPGRDITFTAGTNWTPQKQHKSVLSKNGPQLDILDVNYSEVLSVFGGRNNLGISASAGLNNGAGGVSELGPRLSFSRADLGLVVRTPPAGGTYEPLIRGWMAGQTGSESKWSPKQNFGLSADYKVDSETVVYLKGSYSGSKPASDADPAYFRWKAYPAQNTSGFAADSTYDYVKVRNATVLLETMHYHIENESFTLGGGLERNFFNRTAKLNIDANYSSAQRDYSPSQTISATATGVGFDIDRRGRDAWYPAITQVSGPNWSDPASYRAQTTAYTRFLYRAPSQRRGLKADFRKDLGTPLPAYIKTGFKWAQFHQSLDQTREAYHAAAAAQAAGGLTNLMPYSITMANSMYGPFPFLQIPGSGRPGDLYESRYQTPSDFYNTTFNEYAFDADFTENVYAAYALGQVRLGALRVLAGVRVEETRNEGSDYTQLPANTNNSASDALTPQENITRALSRLSEWRTSKADYRNVFPGLHFVYDITSSLQARLSYTTSIARPTGQNLLPTIRPNEESRTLTAGNPDLQPYTSDNFEFMLEKYFEPVGVVSINAFRKEIKNYFRSVPGIVVPEGPNNGFGGDFANWILTQSRNVGSARISGIELDYSQQFNFLPGFLRGFGVSMNYTRLSTYGDYGQTIGGTSKLGGFTPHSANGSVSYRGRGFDLRLMANYRSEYFIRSDPGTYGAGTGVLPAAASSVVYDTYGASRLIWDFKAQYKINRTYSAFLDVYNIGDKLTRAEYVKNFFGHDIPMYGQRYGATFIAGVKARF